MLHNALYYLTSHSILDYIIYQGHRCNAKKKASILLKDFCIGVQLVKHPGTFEAFCLKASKLQREKSKNKKKKKKGQFECHYY